MEKKKKICYVAAGSCLNDAVMIQPFIDLIKMSSINLQYLPILINPFENFEIWDHIIILILFNFHLIKVFLINGDLLCAVGCN